MFVIIFIPTLKIELISWQVDLVRVDLVAIDLVRVDLVAIDLVRVDLVAIDLMRAKSCLERQRETIFCLEIGCIQY